MKRGVDIPGLVSFYDRDNDYNRVIYSGIKDLDMQSINMGLSIKYVSEGEEFYYLDDIEYKVTAKQFLIVNHQREVSVSIHSDEKVKGVCLYLDPTLFVDYMRCIHQSQENLLDEPYHQSVLEVNCRELVYQSSQTFLDPLIQRIKHPSQFDSDTREDFFYNLTASLAQHESTVHKQVKKINADKKSTREELFRRLLISIQYIHAHLDKKILIKEVARAAFLSEFHFMRSFKQAFGLSPNQYIRKQRIQKASQLLKSGKYSVSEVSNMCGFTDHHYFSRCFKNIMGIPPSKMM